MAEAPTVPGLEDLRARMEDMKATIYERLQTLPFSEKLPGIIFKPPAVNCSAYTAQVECEAAGCYWYTATGEAAPACYAEPQTVVMRVQNILKRRPKLLGQTGGILRRQHTASQLPPFNFPGIASVLLPQLRGRTRGQRRTRPQRKGMHPGIVDTRIAAVERAKGAFPVRRNIAVEM